MRRKSLVIMSIALAAALFLTAFHPGAALANNGFEGINQEEENEDFFCFAETDDKHPVVAGIAETYVDDYEAVLDMFCNGGEEEDGHTGLGQIMLAFQTADLDGDATADELLERRSEGEGWGEIWQDLGLLGQPEDIGPPDDAGPPIDVGPPDDAGPPDNVPPVGTGRP